MSYHLCVLVFLLLFRVWMSGDDSSSWWSVQTKGLDTNLRGVSVRLDEVRSQPGLHYIVWASGSNGVILRSVNDGKTWKQLAVAGGEGLDFRDIEAFDADVAYVLSSGEGDKSRIYKTIDGGKRWKLQYSDKRPGFFLDSLACSSSTHCVALSDPVGGKFLVLNTDDGEHWSELPGDGMPAALPQEGAFAASGTAMALCEGGIYFGWFDAGGGWRRLQGAGPCRSRRNVFRRWRRDLATFCTTTRGLPVSRRRIRRRLCRGRPERNRCQQRSWYSLAAHRSPEPERCQL